jgi:hypothetical protein
VNFKNGANPPRERWQLPPAKTAEESKAAYAILENYVRFMKRFPEVEFITATQAAKLYRDKARGRRFTPDDIRRIATTVAPEVSFQKHDDHALASSEVFALLNEYVAHRAGGSTPESLSLESTPYGPSEPVTPRTEAATTDGSQFGRTAIDVADFLHKQGRVPTSVWLGSQPVPPEMYLNALAKVALDLVDGKPMPETVTLQPAQLAVAAHVADDNPRLWGWIIFPRGFRAPALMDLAKRQAWTLKPAILDRPRK